MLVTGTPVALPIELLSFEVEIQNDIAKIDWVTSSEINNDYLEVQVSENGIDFLTFEIIPGAGNSINVIYYSTNFSVGKGNYYRLKQTDFDGTTSFSNILYREPKISIAAEVKRVNLFYNTVSEAYRGFIIIVYNDGAYKKSMQ